MEITLTKKITKIAKNPEKELGQNCGKKFKRRIEQLIVAENLEALRYAPGRFHELTGNRKGQFACDLEHPYRLIFEPHEDAKPTDGDGCYIWIEIKSIEVLDITDYH